ncbi:hypothetical protein RRG08_054890 [Elysia crispata]|uniref:Uncharacterized protein n=1 Tax=Elysia crispata TaxID=231223 RepID=A0AAE1A6I1_9GAST|nr:hypothetical protein RRG08_054890 [Elysia crispata]
MPRENREPMSFLRDTGTAAARPGTARRTASDQPTSQGRVAYTKYSINFRLNWRRHPAIAVHDGGKNTTSGPPSLGDPINSSQLADGML